MGSPRAAEPQAPERKMLSFQAAANGVAVYRPHSFGGGERAKTLSCTETPAAPATGSQSVRIGASGHVAASGVPGRYVLPRTVMPAQREGLPPLVIWIPYHDSRSEEHTSELQSHS